MGGERDTPHLPIAVSMGEPAGIGTEVLLRAYLHFAEFPPGKGPHFYLIDDPFRVERLARSLDLPVKVTTISDPSDARDQFVRALPVLPLDNDGIDALRAVVPGHPTAATAAAVTGSIRAAVEAAACGAASGIVTLPIQKKSLAEANFPHPGHTEYLGELTSHLPMRKGAVRGPLMILTAGPFRVSPVTVHIPLSKVPEALSADQIVRAGILLHQALLRDYAVPAPRIAVTGLNPHAGEGGHIGREEIEIIAPAIAALREQGVAAIGPVPADTMFHEEARSQYDAALTMYHDQGLIPIKTVAFHSAVNTTLGLPIVRSSPDHGTGLDLVGKRLARPDSLINAIYSADRIAGHRTEYDARHDR